ncbi:hypothetical protein BFP76_09310 [Amylibacter kogurei]|uniref:Uncharacterized protein n=1 Tax=Paramylibacter kogurei TaxID=1889778 RepID=A0A2G5K0Y4_9RHOB|nr:hypothetical protein [Amylibacter kogurei]PIB23206.1 hypothetical protein BFP76_09310 [Amylibacter kogurei]
MPYDYQIIAAIFVGVFGILGILSALVDHRSPISGVIVVFCAVGLGYWAWVLSEGTLTLDEIPNAFFRIMGSVLNN